MISIFLSISIAVINNFYTLLDAMRRTLQAAKVAGIRAILVHAKDDLARAFYEHCGFETFSTDSLTLYRLLQDIRLMLGE